jgi:predicted PurR-regulated permease PerM
MQDKLGGTVRSQIRLLANPSEEDFALLLRRLRESLQPRFVRLTSATGGLLVESAIGIVILMIAVYFFLIDGPSMVESLMRLSPLDDRYERRLLSDFDRTSRAVVLASVLSALAQGCLAAIAYYFVGFESVILLFFVTALMSLVPFLGAASVWVPCVIWLATVHQRWGAAIFLAIYGAAVISSADNVVKMFVLGGRSALHPLLALLSVLGGLQVFGPVGIVVGPMVVVFLQTLLDILNHELASREPPAPESP